CLSDAAPLQWRAFPPEVGDFSLVGGAGAWRGASVAAERFHFVVVSRIGLIGHGVGRARTELCAVLQRERGDLSPYLEGDERVARCALVLARRGILRAAGIQEWSNRAVRGSAGEDGGRCGLSRGDTLRLGGRLGEGPKGSSVGGFDACYGRINARL